MIKKTKTYVYKSLLKFHIREWEFGEVRRDICVYNPGGPELYTQFVEEVERDGIFSTFSSESYFEVVADESVFTDAPADMEVYFLGDEDLEINTGDIPVQDMSPCPIMAESVDEIEVILNHITDAGLLSFSEELSWHYYAKLEDAPTEDCLEFIF